jgi:hypothetical protein
MARQLDTQGPGRLAISAVRAVKIAANCQGPAIPCSISTACDNFERHHEYPA